MLDIFFTKDLLALMKNKSIVFMGDSNIRALYKDFLCLLHENKLISDNILRRKMENSVYADNLTGHGAQTNGRNYKEEREFKGSKVQAYFFFLTRVFNNYVETILKKMTSNIKPDIIIINSCLWDVTRWGAKGPSEFKANLTHLLKRLKLLLPDCLVIWVTTPPISSFVKGGFLVQELQFLKYSIRFHVVEANHFVRKVVVEHGFDMVDSHYHLKLQIHRRCKDGTHWTPPAVRYVTNLLLTHISLAFNVPLPHRYNSLIMAENLERLDDEMSAEAPVQKTKVQVKREIQEDKVAIKAQCNASRTNKENDTPTPKRRKQQRQQAKKSFGPAHHTFLKRGQHKERLNRIRQWQKNVPASDYSRNPDYLSPPDSHQDSGYFPSPSEAYLSNESVHSSQRNITYSSPQSSRAVNYEGHFGAAQSRWRPPLPSEPYCSELPPLPSEPYPFSPQFGIGRTYVQDPFVFPHVPQGQTLHPRIDFTSDDFQAY